MSRLKWAVNFYPRKYGDIWIRSIFFIMSALLFSVTFSYFQTNGEFQNGAGSAGLTKFLLGLPKRRSIHGILVFGTEKSSNLDSFFGYLEQLWNSAHAGGAYEGLKHWFETKNKLRVPGEMTSCMKMALKGSFFAYFHNSFFFLLSSRYFKMDEETLPLDDLIEKYLVCTKYAEESRPEKTVPPLSWEPENNVPESKARRLILPRLIAILVFRKTRGKGILSDRMNAGCRDLVFF